MRISVKSPLTRRVLIALLILVVVWLLVFEIPIFFTPLRSMPERITVYRYGESVTMTQSDDEFHQVYDRLRDAGEGTVAHVVSKDLIMDSYNGNHLFEDEEELFRHQAIVVYADYDSVQQGWLYGSHGALYDRVAFVMDGERSSVVKERLTDGVPVLYKNTESQASSYHLFANYGSLEKVANYVEEMDFDDIGT